MKELLAIVTFFALLQSSKTTELDVGLKVTVSRARGTTVYVATKLPSGPRDSALRAACDALRDEMRRRNRDGMMDLYDDVPAARLHDEGVLDRLSKKDEKLWESHRIASYIWNRANGLETCTIFPNGTGGDHPKMTTIRYSKK